MRPQIEEVEEKSFPCGEADPEEEKVWVDSRVSRETILCHEGLVIFQLFDWSPKSDRESGIGQIHETYKC